MQQKTSNALHVYSFEFLILCGILVLGFLLRAFYLNEVTHNPDFSSPILDASFHDYWAKGLATGKWVVPQFYNDPLIQSIPYQKSPGYPYFLAFIYWLFGSNYLAVRIVQMGIGLVNCILAFFLGRKLFGSTVGLVLSAFMSFYWIFIYFESELYPPVLLVFLSLLLIYVLFLWTEKTGALRCALGGFVLGLFALVRSNILLFWPVAVAWLAWILYRRSDLNKLLLNLSAFIIGTALAISPVTVRNYVVANEFALISTNGGLNLYIGNNELSDGIKPTIPHLKEMIGADSWTPFDYAVIVNGLKRKLGKDLKYSEASSYWAKEAFHYVVTHPWKSLIITFRKAALFWSPKEVANPTEIYFARMNSKILNYLPGNFSVVLALSIAGFIMVFLNIMKHDSQVDTDLTQYKIQYEVSILIILFICIYFVSFLPFLVSARFRVPLIPFLFLFASYGLYQMVKFAGSRDFRSLAGWLGVMIFLYASSESFSPGYKPDLAQWYYYKGLSFLQKGETDQAIEKYLEAIKIKPDFPEAHNLLGAALHKQGNLDEAIAPYRKAIKIKPDFSDAHNNLGVALAEQGKYDEAISHYSKALIIKPDFAEAHFNIGSALAAQEKTNTAIIHYTRAFLIKSAYMEAHHELGVVLAKQGKLKEASTHFSEALRIKPDYAPALHNLELARNLLKQK